MKIVITGANGFLGSNLRARLREAGHSGITAVPHESSASELESAVAGCGLLFHLAGVNRPQDPSEFQSGNVEFTSRILEVSARQAIPPPVVFASTIQAERDNEYGRSKRAAERLVERYGRSTGTAVRIFRLANVFGKWCKPNYNSAVATFCHNIARGIPITVHDPAAPIRLVYVDDVISGFMRVLEDRDAAAEIAPVYETNVGEVAAILQTFAAQRTDLMAPRAGNGLQRALYATYISHLPTDGFQYRVPRHGDPRGVFVEMLKTPDHGQFSYFTSKPGVTRGEHYHHTKTEKFLVIQGTARFGFRNIETGETHEVTVQGGDGTIVESVPGWTHDVSNIGETELVVMLWANEIFDRSHPDTFPLKVGMHT